MLSNVNNNSKIHTPDNQNKIQNNFLILKKEAGMAQAMRDVPKGSSTPSSSFRVVTTLGNNNSSLSSRDTKLATLAVANNVNIALKEAYKEEGIPLGYQNINNNEAEKILKHTEVKEGSYIIRPSSSPGSYALQVKGKNNEIDSYRIEKNGNGFKIDEIKANSVNELMEMMKKLENLPDSKIKGSNLIPLIKKNTEELPGYKNINNNEAEKILKHTDVKEGTFIIRPSSSPGSYALQVKGKNNEIDSYRIEKSGNEFKIYEIKANSVNELMEILKKLESLPDSKIKGSNLMPYQ
jgi:hypothetical protein